MATSEQLEHWSEQGYTVSRGLFDRSEAETLRDHFMGLRGKGTYPGDFDGVDPKSNDPLRKYPRMIHMHRWDDASLKWLIDPRLDREITALTGHSPYAVQTMLYFKPAGARGQALHQDQFYLNAAPGTCLAAWMALDRCDEENGALMVVPGTHRLPLLCTSAADTSQSFTDVTVQLPETMSPIPVIMEPGDVLFFHCQTEVGTGSAARSSGTMSRVTRRALPSITIPPSEWTAPRFPSM